MPDVGFEISIEFITLYIFGTFTLFTVNYFISFGDFN